MSKWPRVERKNFEHLHNKKKWNLEKDPYLNLTVPAPDLRLPDSKSVSNKFLLFLRNPVCGILLQLKWTKTYGKQCHLEKPRKLQVRGLPNEIDKLPDKSENIRQLDKSHGSDFSDKDRKPSKQTNKTTVNSWKEVVGRM